MKYKIWKSIIENPHWNNPYRGYILFASGENNPEKYFDMYEWELYKASERNGNHIPKKIREFLMTDYMNPIDTGNTMDMDIDLNSISAVDDCFVIETHIRRIWD